MLQLVGISLCVAAGRTFRWKKKNSFISSSPLFTRVALWGWKSQTLHLLFLTPSFLSVSLSFLLHLTLNPPLLFTYTSGSHSIPLRVLWCLRVMDQKISFICFHNMSPVLLVNQEWILVFHFSDGQVRRSNPPLLNIPMEVSLITSPSFYFAIGFQLSLSE